MLLEPFRVYDPVLAGDVPAALVTALLAPTSGLTLANFTNIALISGPTATMFYDGSISQLGIGSGLLLTSGSTPGLTNSQTGFSGANNLPGDAQLDTVVPGTLSHDATVLTFDLTPSGGANALQFSVVFGSEEYPEWVDSFPDIAAVYVNDVNYALFNNNPDQPLSVSSANLVAGNFQNNADDAVAPLEYDGISTALTFVVPLTAGVNHIKIAIADLNDGVLDSGIFVSGFSLTSNSGGGGLYTDINGGSGNDNLQGDDNAQNFNGGDGDDTVKAGGGNDVVNGEDGNDAMAGESGNDEINGGTGSQDKAQFSGNLADYAISYDPETGYLIVDDTRPGQPDGTDKVGPDVELLQFADQTLPFDHFLPGSDDDGVFVSTAGNDLFEATATAHTVSYAEAAQGVKVNIAIEEAQKTGHGTDTLVGMVNLIGSDQSDLLTGNALSNHIEGGDGNDKIDGRGGADTLEGGQGNDAYWVDNAADQVIEQAGHGLDSVTASVDFTLGDNLEKLTLAGGASSGAGNALDNTIFGNDLANTLAGMDGADKLYGGAGNDGLQGGAGNDKLDGGTGADTMAGNAGDDSYAVDDLGDMIIEAEDEGFDSVTASIGYTLGANLEKLTLTGSDDLAGTGNALDNTITGNAGANLLRGLNGNDKLSGGAGADTLEGGAGNDKLDGGTGADSLIGGTGNDGYTVDDADDTIVELADEGTDSVTATISFTLSANLEKLVLGGSVNLSGTGNDLANTLLGNAGDNLLMGLRGNDTLNGGDGNDTLSGGRGADVLTGGSGADTFLFDVMETAANADKIKDFVHGTDSIAIDRGVFAGLAGAMAGALDPALLALGTAAATASQHLIYNQATGSLYYDADGAGGSAQVLLATLVGKPALDASDFVLV